ncbi:MAG: hypothetical protein EAZ60_29025 [Oscillatoriales cyanobacterium]|uniref:hypothetical protein n=1 Tax=unclassified Microcoleus TaxID=2642155 RepID=UPI001D7F72A3|nr:MULTISPECIES: hypothetical protein [unclassified Microcoleus]MCC3461276.1 hypothetical protein [Microcoleus sp. PH2017_11_PCY_U_A]TAE81471.1 MAG: hypothetical protein EAZ83_15450 [Oscillatoriales cyanobacterium]MCC3541830.1 hypothetical protein [Microcoleus sp. PH2017_22_RUC_O_B]MCC3563658.1 hypothetical protein [Microcoleus sp. PH2017_27_LUM_O_A]TAE99668.1 MAG: hypothetical protein EAZ79_04850 [Oscillatoriales cyanobacterium]
MTVVSWQLAVGSWQLAVGSWQQLLVICYCLEPTHSQFLIPNFPFPIPHSQLTMRILIFEDDY